MSEDKTVIGLDVINKEMTMSGWGTRGETDSFESPIKAQVSNELHVAKVIADASMCSDGPSTPKEDRKRKPFNWNLHLCITEKTDPMPEINNPFDGSDPACFQDQGG